MTIDLVITDAATLDVLVMRSLRAAFKWHNRPSEYFF